MKIFKNGKLEEIKLGQKVLVARCGSGKSYFGEFGKIEKFNEKNIIIKTDSGSIAKVDYNFNTIGKTRKSGYFASLNIEGREDMIREVVKYWNAKKVCFEYR